MKLEINLKDKNSCIGCPIYFSADVMENRCCPIINETVKFKVDGSYYGMPMRPVECIKRFGK